MLRLIFNAEAIVHPGEATAPHFDVPTACLVDDEGTIAATGYVIAAADVDRGSENMVVGLQFIGEGSMA